MHKSQRPTPYPINSAARADKMAELKLTMTGHQAWAWVRAANKAVRQRAQYGELCGAHCRSTGKPCVSLAMVNGRCARHGGKCTGAKTAAGRTKALSNFPHYVARHGLPTTRV